MDPRLRQAEPRVIIFSVDVGQENDPAALVVGERIGNPPARYELGHLERFELGTRYHATVDRIAQLVEHPEVALAHRFVVVDATGPGRVVMELFEARLFKTGERRSGLLELVGITSTDGDVVTPAKRGFPWGQYNVPKRDVVTALSVVLQGGRMAVAKGSPAAVVWQQEMQKFQRKIGRRTVSYEAEKAAEHDDLVMANANLIWYGEWMLGTVSLRRSARAPAQARLDLKV
ncbi:MAG TPA: hypothetical protein PK435_14255 [Thermoanaerobaculaceae bacterium]|nr:hypothetical protein [Thermoanaerobaculaceae bacterium]